MLFCKINEVDEGGYFVKPAADMFKKFKATGWTSVESKPLPPVERTGIMIKATVKVYLYYRSS